MAQAFNSPYTGSGSGNGSVTQIIVGYTAKIVRVFNATTNVMYEWNDQLGSDCLATSGVGVRTITAGSLISQSISTGSGPADSIAIAVAAVGNAEDYFIEILG